MSKGRVAPERGGPSRKRRPSRLFGIGHNSAGAARRPPTRQFSYWNIRDQRMIAKAKDSHPENGDSQKRLCGIGQGGSCRPVNPALVLAEPVRKCARGPSRQTPRPQEPATRRAGKSASLAPLICNGFMGHICAMRSLPTGRDATGGSVQRNPQRRVRGIERGAGLPAGVLCFRPHSGPTILPSLRPSQRPDQRRNAANQGSKSKQQLRIRQGHDTTP